MALLRSFGGICIALFALAATEIFRTEAVVCYKCDSISLEGCAMTLNETELPYVDCSPGLRCTMSIVDSVTYRGCASNTPTNGATYQKSCTENLCNKGVYPPGRLKCHHCNPSDESCVLRQSGKPNPCRHHHEEDECFTEAIDATQVYRGCRSDTNHTVVNENSAHFCAINGCNEEAAVTRLTCAVCDSRTQPGCKMDLFGVYTAVCNITLFDTCEVEHVLGSLNDARCYTYRDLDHVRRGCSNDLPASIASRAGEMEKYDFCDGSQLCNARCVPQQKCVSCDTATNGDCLQNRDEASAITCASPEASSCYACEYDNWQMKRGCGSPPLSPNTSRCYECDSGAGCNATPMTRCYKCSSTKNANCASWNRPDIGSIEIEECQAPGSPCVMAAFADGTTRRGCESGSLYCNNTMPHCDTCEGNFCNKGPYPANRLNCYQCSDGWNACSDPTPCVPYMWEPEDVEDACIEYLNEDQRVVRGCRSDTPLYLQCLLHNESCRMCYTNGCNYQLDRSYALKPLING